MRPRKQIIIYKEWDDLPLIMGLSDISILTGLGVDRIRQLCADGTIPAFRVGKKWKVEKNDLRKWIDSQKVSKMGA